MHRAIPKQRYAKMLLVAAALALPLALTGPSVAQTLTHKDYQPQDWQLTGTFGMNSFNGDYGTQADTAVLLATPSLSLDEGGFRLSANMPYMHISGRGLVVFDASGNPIVINRRASVASDSRAGWGDLNLSASYTIPSAILSDFEVRLAGIVKVPTGPARRRLSTGEVDFGMNVDVSRQFGAWVPFVTVGYIDRGQPAGFTIYNTTSLSAGTSLELSDHLVATASYDYQSADTPLVPAGHALSGSLSWVRDGTLVVTGYGLVGLSSGSADLGVGFVVTRTLN